MSVTPQQLPLALESATGYSIDDFVVTDANRTAFDMLECWPYWPSPIAVLTGCQGSGKSHLAAVWAAQSFAMRFDRMRLEPAIEVASRGVPVLLEDMATDCFDETGLFHLINTVRQGRVGFPQSSLLMTSQSRPANWQVRLPDLASRLKAILLMEISSPDDILLDAVITKLFADRQLVIEPWLVHYIVRRMERSLSKAAEFVRLVDRATLEQKSRVTRHLVVDVLAHMQAETSDTAGK